MDYLCGPEVIIGPLSERGRGGAREDKMTKAEVRETRKCHTGDFEDERATSQGM